MKYIAQMTAPTFIVVMVGLALVGVSCGKRPEAKRIVAIKSFTSSIPHMSDNNKLIVDGTKFEHLVGAYPFYISVDELDAILFVCANRDYSSEVYYYDLNSRILKSITVDGVSFSRHIGNNDGMVSVIPFRPFRIDVVVKVEVDGVDISKFVSELDFEAKVAREVTVPRNKPKNKQR